MEIYSLRDPIIMQVFSDFRHFTALLKYACKYCTCYGRDAPELFILNYKFYLYLALENIQIGRFDSRKSLISYCFCKSRTKVCITKQVTGNTFIFGQSCKYINNELF